jgi:hypothetical protein
VRTFEQDLEHYAQSAEMVMRLCQRPVAHERAKARAAIYRAAAVATHAATAEDHDRIHDLAAEACAHLVQAECLSRKQ